MEGDELAYEDKLDLKSINESILWIQIPVLGRASLPDPQLPRVEDVHRISLNKAVLGVGARSVGTMGTGCRGQASAHLQQHITLTNVARSPN